MTDNIPSAPPPCVALTFEKKPNVPGHGWNELYNVTTEDGRLVCSTRTPLYSAARELLKEGRAPEMMLELTRKGETGWCMRGTIGKLAKLTIREDGSFTPIVVPYDGDRLAALKARR